VTDDLARQPASSEVPPEAVGVAIARTYVQLVEAEANPIDAGEALERPDAYGRVPIVVRIRRQPPIRGELVLLAIALGASGLLLPLFLALRAVIIVVAVLAVVVGLLSRLVMRVPPGSIGLVVRAGRHLKAVHEGITWVSPNVALSHLVTTRQIAFDVPVSEVRSRDGVSVVVDLMLTLRIANPELLVYTITTGDLDQLVHATTKDAVRRRVRELDALAVLDLGEEDAAALRANVATTLAEHGVEVAAVTFTSVTLPPAFTESLEGRQLAAVRLAEQHEVHALDEQRIRDVAGLNAREAEARLAAVEHEANAEAARLKHLEERIDASPAAARYDLEVSRLRIAERLAGNSRAVVSLGGGDLVANLLLAREVEASAGAGADGQDAHEAPVATPPRGGRRAANGSGGAGGVTA
jgi:regulator of protease activity HflC (stomatin/prohibitin superfamily)